MLRDFRVLYVIGAALVLWAVVVFVFAGLDGLHGEPLGGEGIRNRSAQPGVLLLLASVPLFLAEMLRGAKWEEHPTRGFWRGGGTSLVRYPTSTPVHVLWMFVPLAVYVVLVLLPMALRSGAASSTFAAASADFWLLIQFYGVAGAGVFGVMAASLLKKAAYAVFASKFAVSRLSARSRLFWTVLSAQWRAETFRSFTGAVFAGALPTLWLSAALQKYDLDVTAVFIVTGIALGCSLMAAVVALNAWRSGEPLGYAESVT
ncbi:MAG: hypothetical protein JWR57_1305 [Mycetocola sp.]|nr:hypothetical protein [Mycetocola sp.]